VTYFQVMSCCIRRCYPRAGIALSVEWVGYGLDNWEIVGRFLPGAGERLSFSEKSVHTSPGVRLHVQLEPGAHFEEEKRPGCEATSQFPVLPRLRVKGVIPPFPHITVLSFHCCLCHFFVLIWMYHKIGTPCMEVHIVSIFDVKCENRHLQLNFILHNYSVTLVSNMSRLKPKKPSPNEIRVPNKTF
jgi:hypothetical protein